MEPCGFLLQTAVAFLQLCHYVMKGSARFSGRPPKRGINLVTSARGIGATDGTLPGRTPTATPAAPKDVGSLRGDETILLVEDEELLRPLIREAPAR